MCFRHLDLTSALRPVLSDDETLLFVQDGVGLYHGQDKLKDYEYGHAYLTTHRVCYVDNNASRRFSVSLELKEVDHIDFYAGFLKSSAKITFYPKPSRPGIRSSVSDRTADVRNTNHPGSSSIAGSPSFSRDIQATWICPICGFSNDVPSKFDPTTANQNTPLEPCRTCGIKPPLVHVIKAAISAISNQSRGAPSLSSSTASRASDKRGKVPSLTSTTIRTSSNGIVCPRCTFENDASMVSCEICSASLVEVSPMRPSLKDQDVKRTDSPGPSINHLPATPDSSESVKIAFRAGGEKVFFERLRSALLQRKWLLSDAPPIPQPSASHGNGSDGNGRQTKIDGSRSPQRMVGIAGLEAKGAITRQKNQTVIGTAFEDLEALMTSAKEVIAMAEQFQALSATNSDAMSPEAKALVMDSASALGLVTTKDMLGTGSTSDALYITELSRGIAEFLTDDRRGVLRREGGIISLVDLWAVFNRTRNGIELVSPLDFEKAAMMWDKLNMPIRLRKFRSGSLVVQERSRTDEKTIAALLAWLRQPQITPNQDDDMIMQSYGRGVTAHETAEYFHWSMGVATEELEMAEEMGALCRDQCIDGLRFWQNHFGSFEESLTASHVSDTADRLGDVTLNSS